MTQKHPWTEGPVVLGRSEGYYRRRAAQWLASAASFRRCAQRGGHPFGYPYALQMARDGVVMAAMNRVALGKGL